MEGQIDEALVHVPAVRGRPGLDEGDATDGPVAGYADLDCPADVDDVGRSLDRRAHRQLGTGREQVRRVVDLGIEISRYARGRGGTASEDQDGRIRQKQRVAVIEARHHTAGTDRPLAGLGVPDLGLVADVGHLVPHAAATCGDNLAVRKDGGHRQAALAQHRRSLCHDGATAVDVDHDCLVALAAVLEDPSGAEHRGTRITASGDCKLAGAGDRTLGAGLDVVHLAAAVEAEDPAVRGDEVARVPVVERQTGQSTGRSTGQQAVDAVSASDLGEVGAAAAALHIDLAVEQHRRRGVPALAIHGGPTCQRARGHVKDVALAVAGVGGGRAGPVVPARDRDRLAARQLDLRTAEDVRLRGVRKHHVAVVDGIPDVIDEVTGLLAILSGAVGQDPAIRRQDAMHGDQRPRLDRTEEPLG